MVQYAVAIDGYMDASDLALIAELVASCHNVAEVGFYKGRTTKVLAASCTGTVYAVDHCRTMTGENYTEDYPAAFEANLKAELESGKVVAIKAESANGVLQLGALGITLDAVFVDGDHSYDVCRNDIIAYRRLIRGTGFMFGHDIGLPSVQQAVAECFPLYSTRRPNIWYAEVIDEAL